MGPLFALSLLALGAAPLDGREELARHGCAACHADLAPAGVRAAPDLRLSAARMRPEALVEFLLDPHAAQPDTRMPDMLRGEEDRAATAAALAAFLGSLEAPSDGLEPQPGDAARGEWLFHSVGCVQCHGALAPPLSDDGRREGEIPAPPEGARDLGPARTKYTRDGLAAFLLAPLDHRPSGLMPDLHLSRAEAADLAAYLVEGEASMAARKTPAELVEIGRERFTALGCASCHTDVVARAPESAPLANTNAGCLAVAPPANVPDYGFDDAQRTLLASAIEAVASERSPAEIVDSTLTTFRCTACHSRDGEGGVPATIEAYLGTDEPDLGEPARRPPPLDGVGGKLRRTWLERVLYDGASVRPYMHTRMPRFGSENLAHLPDALEAVDAAEPLTYEKPEREAWNEARDAAMKMVGGAGLGCVNCHSFNGQPGPGFQGLDLLTTPERLRERWYHEFMISPQTKLPGIVMPESWPGGEAVYTSILEGDTERQLAAIWHYLALGTSARNPPGVNAPRWNLDVGDAPRVYRGRSRVAGFRGVAVGFPEGVHVAFDAQNGALAALWRGDFVSVNWNGQGAGDFNPRGRAVELPRDIALMGTVDIEERPWPLRPRTTKEAPVNPDPEYPMQHGYRFRGYRIGEGGVPTIRWAFVEVDVDDTFTPVMADDQPRGVRRRLVFDAARPVHLTLRPLAGPIEDLGDGRYSSGGVVLDVGGAPARVRDFAEGQELLLELDLPHNETTLELTYVFAD